MQKSEAEIFLEAHRATIIKKARNVSGLVDFLQQQSFLTNEMASNICVETTDPKKMRELYKHLNCTSGYELTLKLLEKNESDLIKQLKQEKGQTHSGVRKRLRSSDGAKDVDELDSDLKICCPKTLTLAKLERWVSHPENSPKLISKLKEKLGGLEALEKQLKDKKLKKALLFNADDVKNIEKNRELLQFFEKIRNLLQYQMWVCGIKQAVVIMNQGEKKVMYESFDSILQRCERLVFEALAPALAVFKNLQRQEKFFSL
ncbi:uncharacterized protein LOC125799238 [Astyanax mexicanus]|uniref:uncharacterized protein LOC125799238 n=1 Tax=Astyanax mexicanus TaxID=7994 RepID=UPI0020CA9FAA|nr:uncharacterized protein LOC125799238 [Astyanax mexicanus]